MKPIFLSLGKAAALCSLSRGTLWRWVKAGELKASTTPGGHFRIDRQDLIAFMHRKGLSPVAHYYPEFKRVLVVDDDVHIQKVITRMLSQNGYQVESAADGFEAGIKVSEFKPGLVIMDLLMPKMDGFEACRRIKANSTTAHIKVLVITGHDSKPHRDQSVKAGADAYLPKPLSKKVLLAAVTKLMPNKKKRDADTP